MKDPSDVLFLGVDGGGSKTRAVVATLDGRIVGEGLGDASNPTTVGFPNARRSIDTAIARAAAGIGSSGGSRRIEAACLGLAGLDREADRAEMQAWAEGADFAGAVTVTHDAELILAGGTSEGIGIALICGTGSVALARDGRGQSFRSGGWGYLVGDEGGGYAIGAAALRVATQTADGRADAVRLLEALLSAIGAAEPEAILGFVYRDDPPPKRIAALSEVVFRLAREGDLPSIALVSEAAADAAKLVDVLAERDLGPLPEIALGGGLFRAHPAYAAAVTACLARRPGPVTVVDDPARGAISIAKRLYEGARS